MASLERTSTRLVPIGILIVGSWFGSYLSFPGKPFLSVVNFAALLVLLHFAALCLRQGGLDASQQRLTAHLITPLILFVGVVIWTTLHADDAMWNLRKSFDLVVGLAVCLGFAVAARERIARFINLLMVALWFIVIGICAIETVTGQHLSNSRSGVEPLLVNIPTAFFWNPNDLATAIVLVLPFLWIYNLERGRPWLTRAIIFSGLGVLMIITSRGALLAFALTAILVFITSRLKPRHIILACLMVVVGVFSIPKGIDFVRGRIVYGRSAQGISERFFTRIGSATKAQRDGSFAQRRVAAQNTVEYLNDHTIGMGALGADRFLGQKVNRDLFNPHSLWLELGLAWGIPGLALFLAFWLGLFIEMVSIMRRANVAPEDRALARAALVGLLVFALITNVPSSVLRGFHLVWFPLGVAMIAAIRAQPAAERSGHEVQDNAASG